MSSGLDMASGRIRGMAATHVLNRSILGFLSPLSDMEGGVTPVTSSLTNEPQNTKADRRLVAAYCGYIRDHVLWFFVEHLDAGEHHTTTHLLVQVSQDVVQSLSHLGVV